MDPYSIIMWSAAVAVLAVTAFVVYCVTRAMVGIDRPDATPGAVVSFRQGDFLIVETSHNGSDGDYISLRDKASCERQWTL